MDEIVCIRVWEGGRECWWPAQDYLTCPPAGTFTLTGKQPYMEPVIVAEVQYPTALQAKAAQPLRAHTIYQPSVKFGKSHFAGMRPGGLRG